MNAVSNEKCPEHDVLSNFLAGKLNPPALGECETHVADCPRCHETLRGLDPNDTLSEQVSRAMKSDAARSLQSSDAEAGEDAEEAADIEELMRKLSSSEFRANAQPAFGPFGGGNSSARMQFEMLADRAAEVLRCVEPPETSESGEIKAGDRLLGTLGDYRLLRLIGAGSTGVVFQALDQPLDRLVALKVLRPSLGPMSRERFLAEARSAASIEHVNVVTIFQVGQVDRLAFIAMPWQPGETLETKLAMGDEFDEQRIRTVIGKVVQGLHAAHQRQLVHRDIKPANIWLTDEDEEVRILDFGLARIADDAPAMTATGMLAGTPSYMSPEQAKGQELDGRSDLFSLGCLLYRMLTGQLPFGASTVLATLQAIQSVDPTPPNATSAWSTDKPDDLSDLTMCLLEKQPANRPESAEQLLKMLDSPRDQWPVPVVQYREKKDLAQLPDKDKKRMTGAAGRQTKSDDGSGSRSGNGWRWTTAIAIGLLGLAGWLFAGQIIRIATDSGEVVIETSDDGVEVRVFENGNRIRVIDTIGQTSFDLNSGDYRLEAVDGDSQQPMQVTPSTIIMRRGSKQIVSVTHKPTDKSGNDATSSEEQMADRSGADSIAANPSASDRSESPERSKLSEPVFKGNAFKHWINIARYDRDYRSCTDALEACAMTAESEDQFRELLEITTRLAREHGSDTYGEYRTKDTYTSAFRQVLNAAPPRMVLDFFMEEIENGTSQSRDFLILWLQRIVDGSENVPEFSDDLNEMLAANTRPIFDQFAEHWSKPGTLELLRAFTRGYANSYDPSILATLEDSALLPVLRKDILSDDSSNFQFLLNFAAEHFPDDDQVYNRYETLLLDPDSSAYDHQLAFSFFRDSAPGNEEHAQRLIDTAFILIENAFLPDEQRLQFGGFEHWGFGGGGMGGGGMGGGGFGGGVGGGGFSEGMLGAVPNASVAAVIQQNLLLIDGKAETLTPSAKQKVAAKLRTVLAVLNAKQEEAIEKADGKTGKKAESAYAQLNEDFAYLNARLEGNTLPVVKPGSIFHENRGMGGGMF